MKQLSILGFALLLFCATAPSALAQKVWVVDASGAGDFTDVDPAVSAAANGDALLLRNGTYSDLLINSKALYVLADSGHNPIVGGARILNLSTTQFVMLSGLTVTSPDHAGVEINECKGAVWVENCELNGADGNGTVGASDFHPAGQAGGFVFKSSFVSFINCEMNGGDGAKGVVWPVQLNGGGGAGARFKFVKEGVVQGCRVNGGDGGSVLSDKNDSEGGPGGHCVWSGVSDVTVLGCDLFGGDGGKGGSQPDVMLGTVCGNGGDAGSGIVRDFSVNMAPNYTLANLNYFPGKVGAAGNGVNCGPGKSGKLINALLTPIEWLPMADTILVTNSPVRSGGNAIIEAKGTPNLFAFVIVTAYPVWKNQGPLNGLQLVNYNGSFLVPLGITPTSLTVPIQVAIPPAISMQMLMQLLVFDPATAQASFGGASTLALLDKAL